MPVSDIDIRRSAGLHPKRHGANAEVRATIQADRLPGAGGVDGATVRLRVIAAIVKAFNGPDRAGMTDQLSGSGVPSMAGSYSAAS